MRSDPTTTVEISTLAEFERLPEDDSHRVELVRGRLVREPLPRARHGRVVERLAFALGMWARATGEGEVVLEAGFVLSIEAPTVRGPDVAWVSEERRSKQLDPDGFWEGAPDLAVEVVSPSNRQMDVQEKVLDYLNSGARLVWVVDPTTASVTEYRDRKSGRILSGADVLEGADVLAGFRVELQELFAT